MPVTLYADTRRTPRRDPSLTEDVTADVAIVGGGYTGLSAALHLAEVGVDTVLVEANEIGWGASGRNGGQVNPGLKWTPDQLDAAFGRERGARIGQFSGAAPDLVFDLIAQHKIDCQPVRGGTIRAAVSPRSARGVTDLHRQLQARGARVQLLDAADMVGKTGTDAYPLGLFYPHGGSLNPLAYAYGLADAATRARARIFIDTRATRLERTGETWTLSTPAATIRARHVILATNGYTDDLWPGLRRSVVPVPSSIVATAPLPTQISAGIMPSRASLYEMSSTYTYYRPRRGRGAS